MYNSVWNHDVESVKRILSQEGILGKSVVDFYGISPLNLAAYKGFNDIINHLIEKGSGLKAEENGGNGPLLCAIKGEQPHTVNHLIKLDKSLGNLTIILSDLLFS